MPMRRAILRESRKECQTIPDCVGELGSRGSGKGGVGRAGANSSDRFFDAFEVGEISRIRAKRSIIFTVTIHLRDEAMPTMIEEITRNGVSQFHSVLQQQGYPRSAEDARDAVAICRHLTEAIDLAWNKINEMLDKGTEGRQLLFIVLELCDVLALARGGFPQVAKSLEQNAPALGGLEEDLRTIEGLGSHLKDVRAELAPLISLLEAPPPVVDPAKLRNPGEVEFAPGYVDIDELLK
jgi:hypothetical protein